ncbi:MAG: hypothetical protein FVQ82_09665 [Planctomycetes bacterium]|nr:hypothetical protein [Planctomycetota bacterium]
MRNLRITIWMLAALLTTSTATLADVTEMDPFVNSWGQIKLYDPQGSFETIDLYGPSEIHTFFEGAAEGDAGDDNLNGLDEVAAEIVSMNLAGTGSSFGDVVVRLNPGRQALGEIEETTNNTSGILDLPPFTPTGTANSFFDVFVELEFTTIGIILYSHDPVNMIAVINEKPPAHGDIYQQSGDPVQLYSGDGTLTGFFISGLKYEPNPVQYDWGDAPDNGAAARYPTLASNNGANHTIVPGFMLGASVDAESDGQPNNAAIGDDNDGNDDEDGVTFITWPLIPGRPAIVEVTASAAGLLYAWIDFSADNSWAQAGDQIFDAQPLTTGVNTLVFQVPMTASANITTFSRFRFTTDTTLSFDGPATDGEVEDHTVKIKERCGIKWVQLPDETENGVDICVTNTQKIPRIAADDFQCKKFGLITDIHLWGSWLNDVRGNITNIYAAIYSDDPVGNGGSNSENTYSNPDKLLWEMAFRPDRFVEHLHHTFEPGGFWWDPDPATDTLIPQADKQIWQIDMYIDRTEAFFQEGTPEVPIVYWLAIRVDTDAGEFGWKTRRYPDHYNDDAVFAVGTDEPLNWQELRYPPREEHPYGGSSIDLAFVITTDDYCPARADLNCNGFVDLSDFTIFAEQWLQMSP